MIVTRKKKLKTLLGCLKEKDKIFLIGCAQCATVCKTGGEEQLSEMEALLKENGRIVTGKAILDPACHLVKVKQLFYQERDVFNNTDVILSLTCGDGVQTIKDGDLKKKVVPALDTLFLGEFERGGRFSQKCILCGECIIEKTDALCPLTLCTKGLLNGPCGGSKNKKCEVDKERDCGWILIYERLKERKELKNMKRIVSPIDHSKNLKPQKAII
jgi:ferredoxin